MFLLLTKCYIFSKDVLIPCLLIHKYDKVKYFHFWYFSEVKQKGVCIGSIQLDAVFNKYGTICLSLLFPNGYSTSHLFFLEGSPNYFKVPQTWRLFENAYVSQKT